MTESAQVRHQTPPHSVEGEMGVLGSMLKSPREGIAEVMDNITGEYFYIPRHQTVHDALVSLWEEGHAIDLITFTQFLADRKVDGRHGNLLEAIGGPGFVSELYTFVPTAANLGYYIDIVREKYVLRQIISSATEAARRAYDEQDDPGGLLEDYQSKAIEIGQTAKGQETSKPLAAFVPDALKQIELTYKQRGHCTGISTGFVDLDRTMNGFENGMRPYCFAARPSMGKSSLMLAFAKNIALAAIEQRKKVKIFSLEMTGQQLAKRLICDLADIKLKELRHGFMDKTAIDRANEAAKRLMTEFILIDEKGDLSVYEFRARARQAVVRQKCDIIMIDYLQRMRGSSKRAQLSRELEINEICQGISASAKELRVPHVVLAQLNREPEKRKGGRPELGDLRESGSIEQEMGFVGLLYRASYYANTPDKVRYMMSELEITSEEDFKQYAECIVAKQNEGPVGPVPLRFIEDFARYVPDDPDRPLFSSNKEKQQEVKSAAAQREAAIGEPEQPPTIVQEALAIFPGSKTTTQPDDIP